MALNWDRFQRLRRENPIPKFALDKASKSLKKSPTDPYLQVLCAPKIQDCLFYSHDTLVNHGFGN
jgi:hypothetical protein